VEPLDPFSAPVREWFLASFGQPTPVQSGGWPAIAGGGHALLLAPTGSGKTLAAFLWSIDRLMAGPERPGAEGTKSGKAGPERPGAGTRVLYLSPLRALAVDVDKNLRAPLKGIALAGERLGVPLRTPVVGMRTGDTDARDRRQLIKHPPDILITTPESLYLMLTSSARETLRDVEHVIIDEIHAIAGTKRGAHLALSLERLEEICHKSPQRIGLSATQRPLDEIARFLGGTDDHGTPRPVRIVDAGVRKPLAIEVIVPVDDMGAISSREFVPAASPGSPELRSIWPSIHPMVLDLIESHRSTIVFVNARRLAERLAAKLNELAAERAGVEPEAMPQVVKAHHGSLSRERRLLIEDELKTGKVKAIVATSSLELGIDMGLVDLVIQVESPGAVARGLQRVGRAGHQVGEPSKGTFFPKHRNDLLETAVVVDRMQRGLIEETHYPRNPLDVLAQQIVAMCALDDWPVARLATIVRRAANFTELTDDVFTATLDLLAGRYPSEEFAELRPRIVWDRVADTVRGRAGAQRLAVTSGGTIPDRGLFGVFTPDGTRIGELDEEMVYESRPGETFLLGASTWRIEDITFERVIATPAPGLPGKMPFWKGDGPGRPIELGRALGEFVRTVRAQQPAAALERLKRDSSLDERAAANVLRYLDEQADATGVVPDDRTIVVERFRDEIGDWRVCIHTPFGSRVHAPWAIALRERLRELWGVDPEMLWSDDGIVVRLAEAVDEFPIDALLVDPADIDELVVSHLPSTALFASRFRECAARALLLPRRRPDRRTPLWQQRQRAADLLAVAAKYPQFPMLLETMRECCNDVFDLPALRSVLTDIGSRRVRVVAVDSQKASPMAQSLLFGWIAVYMYENDAPLAERRAAALALDRDLLRELLGAEELRELLDPDVLATLELELQRLVPERHAYDADTVHDLVRVLGPLTRTEIDLRCTGDATAWIDELLAQRRVIDVQIAGQAHLAAAEDAARLRDALGTALPPGLPAAYTDPVDDPLGDLVARYGRTHGPFVVRDVATRFALEAERVHPVLDRLVAARRLVRGEFRPEGLSREWCDADVLRQLRRRSLAALRREIEPVEADAYARFLPAWQGVGVPRRGIDGVVEAIGVLQGAAIPASVLEADSLPARVVGYRPTDLDALCTAGEVVWIGSGASGAADGRVRLYFRDQVASLAPSPVDLSGDDPTGSALHGALLAQLERSGASFWTDLVRAASDAGQPYDDASVLAALWDLVWAGEVTNDSLAPVRSFLGGSRSRTAGARGTGRGRPRPGRLARLGPPAGAGRWSLVRALTQPRPDATVIAHAHALQLLERYGVLTRESALGEGVVGGFAGVYPMLNELEARGQVRRGYFVAGLGAAQFALPGAVDRLRAERVAPDPYRAGTNPTPALVLAATDPAQPFGAALAWPETSFRPARAAGAHVVLHEGALCAYLERGAKSVVTFTVDHAVWAAALVERKVSGRVKRVELTKIDGVPAREHAAAIALRAVGFVDSYRGLLLP
jgi:ATP-dependent Lhr-like helicase